MDNKCPHCGFECSIDVLGSHLRWHCLKCQCVFQGDGNWTFIGGSETICPEVKQMVKEEIRFNPSKWFRWR